MTVLEDARATIEKGWYQGYYHSREQDRFCAIGAIAQAQNSNDYAAAHLGMFTGLLAKHLPDLGWQCHLAGCSSCWDVAHFNDDPDTTKDMVLALFDKAIADEHTY